MSQPPSRRAFLELSAIAALAPACSRKDAPERKPPAPAVPVDPSVVRIASVPTAVEGDVLPELLKPREGWILDESRQRCEPPSTPRAAKVGTKICGAIVSRGQWPR